MEINGREWGTFSWFISYNVRDGNIHIDVHFAKVAQDWELEHVASFTYIVYYEKMERINCVGIDQNVEWLKSNLYKVSKLERGSSFPWKSIWKPKVPSRGFFFFR